MTTVFGLAGGSSPRVSLFNSSPSAELMNASCSRILRKPGPATSSGAGERAEVDLLRHLRGHLARWSPDQLGQRHAAIGLIVAKLGIGTGTDSLGKGRPINALGQDGDKRFAQASE